MSQTFAEGINISNTYTTKLLKQFGRTDGILSGGNMATGLIIYYIIATTEGFGREGIVLATFLMFFLSAVLEIPTGYLGDRLGWKFSVQLGLLCDFASTLLFSLTVVCAIYGFYIWMLVFLIMRQLCSALNCSFTSGSYQAAYQHWYQERLERNNTSITDAPPLFLASYKYGIVIRLGLPIIALGIGLLLQSEQFSHVAKEYVVLVPLGLVFYIFMIQVMAYYKMARDLNFTEISNKVINSSSSITVTKLFLSAQATLPVMCAYAFSHIFLQVNHIFLIGESYYLFQDANLPQILIWGGGMGAAVISNFLSIAVSRSFIPWLTQQSGLRTIRWVGMVALGLLSFIIAIAFYSDISTIEKITIMFLAMLIADPICYALRAEIASDSYRFVPDEFKASWFSGGALLARLTYAMIAGLILVAGVPHMSIIIMMSILGAIAVILSVINYRNGGQVIKFKRTSLKKCLATIIGMIIFITTFIALLVEVGYFVQQTTQAQRQQDHSVTRQYAAQLSHAEDVASIEHLANALMSMPNVDCVDINVEFFQSTDCDSQNSNYRAIELVYQSMIYKKEWLGSMTVYFNDSIIHQKTLSHLAVVLTVYIFFLIFVLGIIYRIVKYICEAQLMFGVGAKKIHANTEVSDDVSRYFIEEFAIMADKYNELVESEKRKASLISANKILTKVVHDIRSPLTALEMLAKQSSNTIPEQNRNVLSSAINSMKDIVQSLLMAEQEKRITKKSAKNNDSKQLLPILLEEITIEKRLELRAESSVELQYQIDDNAYGVFIEIYPNTLRQILSSLVDSMVKAKNEQEHVHILLRLQVLDNKALISIVDSSQVVFGGIINKLLDQKRNARNVAKRNLAHAKEIVESCGGELSIEPSLDTGTRLVISLPLQPAPKWFLSSLQLPPKSQVLVLDDDGSMHNVWRSRLASLPLDDARVEVHYFRDGAQLTEFYRQQTDPNRPLVFLSDYELIGDESTGLDIIKILQLAEHSVLVTSHHRNIKLLQSCTELGIKILPKPLVNWLPIKISKQNAREGSFDAVHIDDNEEVRYCWCMDAKQNGVRLLSLSSPKEFDQYADKISLQTPIYIDNGFVGERLTGAEWARIWYEQGFKRLILTTGMAPASADEMYWLRAVTDKFPPWFKGHL